MSRYMAGKVNIGLEVEKEFGGKRFKGWVTKYFRKEDLYHVKYEDDDEEDVDADELQRIVTSKLPQTEAEPATAQNHGASGSKTAIGRPRRMPRASMGIEAAAGSPSLLPRPQQKAKTATGAAVPSGRVPQPQLGVEERSSQAVSPDTAAAETLFTLSSVPEPAPPTPSQPGTPFPSPKRKQETASTAELHSPAGPGASKRAVAAAPLPQSPAQKRTRTAAPKAAPSQAGPSQAAEAEPLTADAPVAEAEARAAGGEPAAATEPVTESEPAAEAEPVPEAAPVVENGGGPSEPEAPTAAAEAPTADEVARRPTRGFRRAGRDAVEDLYKDVDILRSHPATGGRPGPARFNQVVYCRGFLFLAGQIVYDTSSPGMDTYYGQAKKVLHQVGQLLEDSGSCMERVLQVAVHLRNIDHGADEFNKAWLEVMPHEHLPARTTVQAHLMRPDLLVEVTATAALPK